MRGVAEALADGGISLEERLLLPLEFLDVLDVGGGAGAGAEEELQQQFAAEALVPGGGGEPSLQLFAPARRERIQLPVRLALLARVGALRQPLVRQLAEHGIDLPITLTPEMRDRSLDPLLQVIPRPRPQAQ